jgi:hypothetical protein
VGEDGVDEKFAGFVEAASSLGCVKAIEGRENWRVEQVGGFKIIVRGWGWGGELRSLVPEELHEVMETWVAGGDKDKLVRKREEVRKNEWVRDVLERRRSSASETSLASMQSLMSAGSGGSGDKQDEEVRKVQNALKTTDLETVGRLEEEYPMRLKELEELLNESPVRMVRLRIAERVMGVFGAYGAKEGGGKGGIGTTELLKLCKVVGSVVYVNGAVASVPDGSEATWDARYKSYAELFFKDGWGKEGQFEGFVTTDGAKEWEEEGREDERVRRARQSQERSGPRKGLERDTQSRCVL